MYQTKFTENNGDQYIILMMSFWGENQINSDRIYERRGLGIFHCFLSIMSRFFVKSSQNLFFLFGLLFAVTVILISIATTQVELILIAFDNILQFWSI